MISGPAVMCVMWGCESAVLAIHAGETQLAQLGRQQ